MSVIDVLMERDGMSREEATRLVEETRDMLLASDPFEADDIMADMLGLEPDYIMEVLFI